MGESDDVDGNTNQLESEGEGLVNKKLITPNILLLQILQIILTKTFHVLILTATIMFHQAQERTCPCSYLLCTENIWWVTVAMWPRPSCRIMLATVRFCIILQALQCLQRPWAVEYAHIIFCWINKQCENENENEYENENENNEKN